MYVLGNGVDQDIEKGVGLIHASAEGGNAVAQTAMGCLLAEGQHYAEAIHWFARAAEQEHGPAYYYMGLMAFEGLGVDRNTEQSFNLMNKAVIYGYTEAPERLQAHLDAKSDKHDAAVDFTSGSDTCPSCEGAGCRSCSGDGKLNGYQQVLGLELYDAVFSGTPSQSTKSDDWSVYASPPSPQQSATVGRPVAKQAKTVQKAYCPSCGHIHTEGTGNYMRTTKCPNCGTSLRPSSSIDSWKKASSANQHDATVCQSCGLVMRSLRSGGTSCKLCGGRTKADYVQASWTKKYRCKDCNAVYEFNRTPHAKCCGRQLVPQ
jgi:hypothetical protein